MNAVPGPKLHELLEIAIDRRVRREILGQHAPLAAGPEQVQQRVHHLAHVGRAWTSSSPRRRHQRSKNSPLRIGQIACVPFARTAMLRACRIRPHGGPPNQCHHS